MKVVDYEIPREVGHLFFQIVEWDLRTKLLLNLQIRGEKRPTVILYVGTKDIQLPNTSVPSPIKSHVEYIASKSVK